MPAKFSISRPTLVLIALSVLAALSIAAFMLLGAKGSWAFVLKFRGLKLAGLILVAYSIAVSTVLFQTVTNNRILTPSVMGFDALYVLLQTSLFFTLGSAFVVTMDPQLKFIGETLLLIGFAAILYRWLFISAKRSLHMLILVGIIFGILFRSLSGFMQRVLDPNEFVVLQDTLFASFNSIDSTLLAVSYLIVIVASLIGFRFIRCFDVLALGRPTAICLGLNYNRIVTVILFIVATMVAVSTALVGPVMFFGLLVAALAHYLTGISRHSFVLPVAILLAVICLVGGQVVLERVFAFDTALSIIIEFVGGIVFLVLVLKKGAR
jgi:iron complex transport system permease protein